MKKGKTFISTVDWRTRRHNNLRQSRKMKFYKLQNYVRVSKKQKYKGFEEKKIAR